MTITNRIAFQFPALASILASTVGLAMLTACQSTPSDQTNQTSQPEVVEANPDPSASEMEQQTADSFLDAMSKAMTAAEQAQTAQTVDEWQAVAKLWAQSTELMKAVSDSSSNYRKAQQKINEYKGNQEYAEQRVNALVFPHSDTLPAQVSRGGGGLGDRLSVLIGKYGNPDPEKSGPSEYRKVFNCSNQGCQFFAYLELNGNYVGDRVNAVEQSVSITPEKNISQNEALLIAESLIPSDAQKQKEFVLDQNFYTLLYTSESLKQLFPEDQGKFHVFLEHSDNDINAVYQVLAGMGHDNL